MNYTYLEEILCNVGVLHSVFMSTDWREWRLRDDGGFDAVGDLDLLFERRLLVSTSRGLAHRDLTGLEALWAQQVSSGRQVPDLMEVLWEWVLDSDLVNNDVLLIWHDMRWWPLSSEAREYDGESLRFSIFTFTGDAATLPTHPTSEWESE